MPEKSGAAKKPWKFTSVAVAISLGKYAVPSPHKRPMGIAMSVVTTIPIISAPFTRRATSTVVSASPMRKVTVGGDKCARRTTVTGSLITSLALTRPITVMNRPMPHEIA